MEDERIIVPLEPETEPTPPPFNSQWKTLEDIPACDVGMLLLKEAAESAPFAYELALKSNFVELKHPVFKVNAKWAAFIHHRNTCENCNEV